MRRIPRSLVLVLPFAASVFLARCSSSDGGGSNLPPLGACKASALNWEAWVARESKNDLMLINGPRFQLRMMLNLAPSTLTAPYAVAFSNDDDSVAMHPATTAAIAMKGSSAANFADAGVVIADTKTRAITSHVVTNAEVNALAFRPGDQEIWAVAPDADKVFVIDVTGATITASIAIGGTGKAAAIVFNKDGSKAYVASTTIMAGKSSVTVIDAGTKMAAGQYSTGGKTNTLAITPDDKTIYVANEMDGTVESIDLSAADKTMAVKTVAMGLDAPYGILLGRNHVVVGIKNAGKVLFIDPATGKTDQDIAVGAGGAAAKPGLLVISPECNHIYTVEEMAGTFTEVDAKNFKLKGSLDLMGGAPHGIAMKSAPSDM